MAEPNVTIQLPVPYSAVDRAAGSAMLRRGVGPSARRVAVRGIFSRRAAGVEGQLRRYWRNLDMPTPKRWIHRDSHDHDSAT